MEPSTYANDVATAHELSVVVPTRNEAAVIRPFLDALLPALAGIDAEVVFVDDSTDGTPSIVRECAAEADVPIRLCHRMERQRVGGLGGAVKRGFELADGRFVAVMDADLQHPPAVLRAMVSAAVHRGADVVVGSRFAPGGSVGDFGTSRRMISRGSSTLAKVFFPRRLRDVSDPMSGFFVVRRERIVVEELEPQGFKILLELLVRARGVRIAEVPYTFGERVAGESKASFHEGARYLAHLLFLRVSAARLRTT